MKEEKRLIVVEKIMYGGMEIGAGASALGLSERQMYRLMASVRQHGPSGLMHGNLENQYTDRHTILHSPKEPTVLEQLEGTGSLTQFGAVSTLI
ncbi:MAG: hypothetical protein AAB300_02725 [Nitrospirota bacterium]